MPAPRIFAAISVTLALVFPLRAAPGPMELFSTTAATYGVQTSNDAYPIGNGRVAAMIYGGVAQEIIQFNEDTVWAGQPRDYSRVGAVDSLATIRAHVWAGRGEDAYNLGAKNTFMSSPLRQSPYQPTANLRLNFAHTAPSGYRRSLDLDTALASVTYVNNGVTYTRESFASFPDQVIVVRLAASQAGALSFNYTFDTLHTETGNVPVIAVSGSDLIIDAKVKKDANTARQQTSSVRFRARVKIQTDGGTVTATGSTVTVTGATSATLLLGVATNFVSYDDLSADPVARTTATLDAAAAKTHAQLRAAHITDHQALFRRVEIDLNSSNQSTLETSARLQRLRDAAAAVTGTTRDRNPAVQGAGATALAGDLQLLALNFQMARYLYIAGSRPGSQPLNLQGKWNNELDPAWESKMTLNINQEMNYWGVEMMNLAECHLPMLELTRDLSETGAIVAQRHYGASGWMVHHNTDLWRGAAPINNPGGLWPSGGAWLSMHLWSHYRHTRDAAFLANAYPLMKGAAQFFVDFLVTDPRAGRQPYLLTNPSHSPEQPNPALGDNGELVAGTTMDNQLIRGLFDAVIGASETLGVDADFRATLAAKRALLPPNQIGRLGQLQEWLEDVDVPNEHRHLSALVGLFPSDEISAIYEPALAAAAKVHLDWKSDTTNNTSWSQAWKMCLHTTLFDGDRAFLIFANLLRTSHSNNLTFSIKGGGAAENQIDGNFGSAAGIGMLFLQTRRGEIHLLPALPSAIPQGSIKGLRAPGAFTVDLAWSGGQLASAKIHSDRGETCRIRSATPFYVRHDGNPVPLSSPVADVYEFSTSAGSDYTLFTGPDPLSDTDGDGLNDATETTLSDMGLNPTQDSTAWLTLLNEHGPTLGLYTREQLLRAEAGSRLLARPEGRDDFRFRVRVEESDTLEAWRVLDQQAELTPVLNAGVMRFSHANSRPRQFYRFAFSDFFTPTGPVLPAVELTDTDNDQIPDVTEAALASMGFAVGPDSSALRQRLIDNAAGLGRFTTAAVRGLRVTGPINFTKLTPALTSFELGVSLENSPNTWITYPLSSANTLIAEDNAQINLPSPSDLAYYRCVLAP